MVHFFNILAPARQHDTGAQKPFFSDHAALSKAEADAELLTGKSPPQPDPQLADRDESYHQTRFVSLLSPPYF